MSTHVAKPTLLTWSPAALAGLTGLAAFLPWVHAFGGGLIGVDGDGLATLALAAIAGGLAWALATRPTARREAAGLFTVIGTVVAGIGVYDLVSVHRHVAELLSDTQTPFGAGFAAAGSPSIGLYLTIAFGAAMAAAGIAIMAGRR